MKILIADDHTLVRNGFKMLLTREFPFAEIAEVSDSIDLIKALMKNKWDIIISDITMPPGDSGLETLKKIKEFAPGTPVIILTMHSVKEYAVRAIRAGASGFVHKGDATTELIKAVNHVLSGRKYLSPEVADIMANSLVFDPASRSIDNLSNRELEVFKLLATGKSVSAIAKEIYLSANTISTFRTKIFEKMGFHNNMELIKYGVDNKIV